VPALRLHLDASQTCRVDVPAVQDEALEHAEGERSGPALRPGAAEAHGHPAAYAREAYPFVRRMIPFPEGSEEFAAGA